MTAVVQTSSTARRRRTATTRTAAPLRTALVLVGALLVPMLLAGCSGATDGPSDAPSSGASEQSGLALAACMRDKGYPFDDPDPARSGSSSQLSVPDGVDPQRWNADFLECAGASGAEGRAQELPGADDLDRARAACFREHGYEDFPDDAEQQSSYTPADPSAFDAVAQQCDRSGGHGTGAAGEQS